MFNSGDLTDVQRDQLRAQFRERIAGLTDTQRRAVFAGARDQWRLRDQQRMDEFYAMPRAEQRKKLDESINRMLSPRNQPRLASADRGARGGGTGAGQRGANMTPAQRDARSKQRLDRNTPKERAQRSEYRRQIRERMQQRGINPETLPGRRRGIA
jgi:hypothetical protein